MTRRAIPYADALLWIVQNDDIEWLHGPQAGEFISVTACLIADIYGRTNEEVTADLLRCERRLSMRKAA